MRREKWFLVPIIGSLLASCGGGSGDDGGSPPPPPPSDELEQLELQSSGSDGYFSTTFDFFALSRSLSLIGVSGYRQFVGSGTIDPSTVNCTSGGTITFELQDNDASTNLSAGDGITITYDACVEEESTIDAVLQVEARAIGVQSFDYALTIDSFREVTVTSTVEAGGGLDAVYTYDDDNERLQITVAELTSAVTRGGDEQSLVLREATYDYSLNYVSLRYMLAMSGRIDIETGDAPGYFEFESGPALGSVMNNDPAEGELRLQGAGGTFLRLEAQAGPHGRVFYPDDSGNEVDMLRRWSEMIDSRGYLPLRDDVEIPVDTFRPIPRSMQARSVDMGANASDIVHDPARERLYVAVPARNEVAVVSTADYRVLERIRVGSRPTDLSLSQDHTRLQVANLGNGTISLIELDSGNISTIDVAPVSRTARVFGVTEAAPGVLLTSAALSVIPAELLSEESAQLLRIDRDSGSDDIRRVAATRSFNPIRFLPDPSVNSTYAAASNTLLRLELASDEVLVQETLEVPLAPYAEFLPDGETLYVSGRRVSTEPFVLQPDREWWPGRPVEPARLSPDGTHVWSINAHSDTDFSEIRVYDEQAAVWTRRWSAYCPGAVGDLQDLLPMSDSEWVFVKGPSLCVVSAESPGTPPGLPDEAAPRPPILEAPTDVLVLGDPAGEIAVDSSDAVAYVPIDAMGQSVIKVVDVAAQVVVESIPLGRRAGERLLLSADGGTLYASSYPEGGLVLVDTATRTVVRAIDLPSTVAYLVEEAPDVLIFRGDDGSIYRIDLGAGDALETLAPGFAGSVGGIALSPDSSTLYFTHGPPPRKIRSLDLTQPNAPLRPQPDSYEIRTRTGWTSRTTAPWRFSLMGMSWRAKLAARSRSSMMTLSTMPATT